MKDIKYVMFKKKNGDIGVVEAFELSDGAWLLVDRYKDLDKLLAFSFGWEKISRENIIGCFENFEKIKKFLEMICDECEITWV